MHQPPMTKQERANGRSRPHLATEGVDSFRIEAFGIDPAPGSDGLPGEAEYLHVAGAYALHQAVTERDGVVIDLRCLELNQDFEQLVGLPGEEILGRSTSDALPELELEKSLATLGEVAFGGQPVRFEHRAERLRRRFEISAFSPRHGQVATVITDVTHRWQTREALRVRTAYLQQLFERSPLAIVLLDNDENIVECNRGFESMFGFERLECRGRRINHLIVGDEGSPDARILTAKVLQGDVVDTEGVRYRKDGLSIDVRILAHPIWLDERQIGIYVIYSDISRRKRDSLTELVNRSAFMERLEMELERARSEHRMTAVLALDVDHLKDVNDTYGLAAGDGVLRTVASRLRRTLRGDASLARLGGDEFGILQRGLEDVGNAEGLARRLLSCFDEPVEIGDSRLHVRASLGIAIAAADRAGTAPEQLVAQAERALAEAKAEGRGRYRIHTRHMDREVRARMRLVQQLYGELVLGELVLVYQPKISLPDMRLAGVEALLRWRHPDGERVGPDRFIPVAEATGAIIPIGTWVLRTACEQARQWQDSVGGEIPVAVNLSPVQFKDPGFAETVLEILDETGLRPDLLELELTERVLVEATETVNDSLGRLRDCGVRLALDDFGRGYSSMDYIRQLPLQKLKIDRSFIRNLDADRSDAAIVSAITVLGSRLGLRVLAEGVERKGQLDLLIQEGCHEIQGFYFSPPVGPEKVADWLPGTATSAAPREGRG